MDTGNLLRLFHWVDFPALGYHNSNSGLLRLGERVADFNLEWNRLTCGSSNLIGRDTREKSLRAKVGCLRQELAMQAIERLRVRSNLLGIRRCHS